jgi:hypothetical protein
MKARPHSRLLIFLLAAGVAAVLAIIVIVPSTRRGSSPQLVQADRPQTISERKPSPLLVSPSLYCAFNDFGHERIVVAFAFTVALQKSAQPRFEERYQGSNDGTRTFDIGHRPAWPFAHDDDGTPVITSPDGATRIVLYGLKLDTGGVFLIEAGLRSNDYRNLDGECQQANFGRQS